MTPQPRVVALLLVVLVAVQLVPAPGLAIDRGTTSTASGARAGITLDRPTGTETGDLMLAMILFVGGLRAETTPPAGWTLGQRVDSGTSAGLATYWRVASDGEPASYTWGFDPPRRSAGILLSYTGVVSNDPIMAIASAEANSNAVTAPSISATEPDAMLVTFHAIVVRGDLATPAGMQERASVQSLGLTAAANDETRADEGPTGERAAATLVSRPWVAQSILLRPVRIGFDAATGVGPEATPAAGIALRLNGPAGHAVTVGYEATGGSASAGTHYLIGPGVVTIPAGSLTATVPVTLVDDADINADRTFDLRLLNPSKAVLGTPATYNFTILNDDVLPEQPSVGVTIIAPDGGPAPSPGWGGWSAAPGAVDVDAQAYLRIENTGPVAPVDVVVDFTGGTFAGALDATASIPIDGNVRFGVAQGDATTTSPQGLSLVWGDIAASGTRTVTLQALDSVVYVTYRIAAVPEFIPAQAYTTGFTVTEL